MPTAGQVVQLQVSSTTTTAPVAVGTGGPLLTVAEVVVAIAIIVLVGTVLSRLVARIALRAGASKSVASSVRQWVAVLMIASGVAAVASLTGVSTQFATLTLSGIAGLAITLALQSTLSNIIAGVLMLQDGFLRIGDEIEFGAVRGEVVKLSLRTTWVKTRDGVIAVIGNNNLSAGPIVNFTARTRLERKLEL